MPRTGGDRTRARILAAAEKLFSRDGFDATSVDAIARAAGVNKALIYYHFESKDDLLLRLLESVVDEVEAHAAAEAPAPGEDEGAALRRQLRAEVEFLAARRPIVTLLLAEALRAGPRQGALFRCADLVARREHPDARRPSQRRRVHEFFTGFIPLVAFVALRDAWCEHSRLAPERIVDDFVEAFARSHVASHEQED